MAVNQIPQKAEDSAHASGDLGVPFLGVRQDTDVSPASADGDYQLLQFNQFGRLKVSVLPGANDPVTGNITTNTGTVFMDVMRVSNVVASVVLTGVTSAVFTFEYSPNSTNGTDGNWFQFQVVRTNANTVEPIPLAALSATPVYGWEMSVNAYKYIRVRASAGTFGTAAWTLQAAPYATEPLPVIQPHGITGNVAVTMAANATTTPAKARDGATAATDTGIPSLFVRRDTPTTLTPVAGDYELAQIDQHGAQWVREKTSTTSALTNVTASITNVTVLALNAARKGATIYNDSTSVCYLKLGATATATSFTVKLAADDYFEVPANYTGIIDGIWVAANGAARVTEFTS